MNARFSALVRRLIGASLLSKVVLAFAVGFVFTGLAVPQLRFLWASFQHAGF